MPLANPQRGRSQDGSAAPEMQIPQQSRGWDRAFAREMTSEVVRPTFLAAQVVHPTHAKATRLDDGWLRRTVLRHAHISCAALETAPAVLGRRLGAPGSA